MASSPARNTPSPAPRMTASDVTATDAGFNSVRSAGFALQSAGGPGFGTGTAFLQIAATLAQPEYPPAARTLDQIKSDQLEAKNRQQQLEYKPPEVEKVFAAVDGTPTNARIQVKGDRTTLGPEV